MWPGIDAAEEHRKKNIGVIDSSHGSQGAGALDSVPDLLADGEEKESELIDALRRDVNDAAQEWVVHNDHGPGAGFQWLSCCKGEIFYTLGPRMSEADLYGHVYRWGIQYSGFVSAKHIRPCPEYHFYVRIVRQSEKNSLGVHLLSSDDGASLVVNSIVEGYLVDRWNRSCVTTCPRDMIRRGDTVLAVNGVQGTAELLRATITAELRAGQLILKLLMHRAFSLQ